MYFNIDVNPEERLLGLYFCNGETEFGEDVKVYSLGVFFFFQLTYSLQQVHRAFSRSWSE